ncbi:MAG: VRR-NUC domain-containing protein [Rhizobiales bacterium]|nr:VRR-NUC domain-containing protein [Hyphomicrobiales bacterium]
MKAEGQRAGIPDLCLPVARRGFNACYVEMKRIGGRPSSAQLYILEMLREYGNLAIIAYGAGEAIRALEHYLAE